MTALRTLSALTLLVLLAACGPSGQRPGLWLAGEAAPLPADWRFTDGEKEIAIEVHTPYLLPHSVTIWCAELDGTLYVAASNPDSKRWPGWVDQNPDVRLGIAGKTYDVHLTALSDPAQTDRLRAAYAAKYELKDDGSTMGIRTVRYWRVGPRA